MTDDDLRHLHARLDRIEDAVGVDDNYLPYPSTLNFAPTDNADVGVQITIIGEEGQPSESIALSEPDPKFLSHPNKTTSKFGYVQEIRIDGELTAPVEVELCMGVLQGTVVKEIKP